MQQILVVIGEIEGFNKLRKYLISQFVNSPFPKGWSEQLYYREGTNNLRIIQYFCWLEKRVKIFTQKERERFTAANNGMSMKEGQYDTQLEHQCSYSLKEQCQQLSNEGEKSAKLIEQHKDDKMLIELDNKESRKPQEHIPAEEEEEEQDQVKVAQLDKKDQQSVILVTKSMLSNKQFTENPVTDECIILSSKPNDQNDLQTSIHFQVFKQLTEANEILPKEKNNIEQPINVILTKSTNLPSFQGEVLDKEALTSDQLFSQNRPIQCLSPYKDKDKQKYNLGQLSGSQNALDKLNSSPGRSAKKERSTRATRGAIKQQQLVNSIQQSLSYSLKAHFKRIKIVYYKYAASSNNQQDQSFLQAKDTIKKEQAQPKETQNFIVNFDSVYCDIGSLKNGKYQNINKSETSSELINEVEGGGDQSKEELGCLQFESRFESGNLLKAGLTQQGNYDLLLQNDINTLGYTQWFFFSVKHTKAGNRATFNILNLEKPRSLFSKGMKIMVYSTKQFEQQTKGWHRAGENITYSQNSFRRIFNLNYYTLSFSYQFLHDNDEVYFACNCPYTFTQLQQYLDTIEAQNSRILGRRLLCRTLAGNRIDLLTITSQNSQANKQGIVLSARVHPGETVSSFVMKGIIDFLLGDSKEAVMLRDQFIFKIVPMLNADGVVHGNYRCSLSGSDLNRKWRNPQKTLHPEIYYFKKMIFDLAENVKVALFCDLHGHSVKKNIFFYGCHDSGQPLACRELPFLLSKLHAPFSFGDCNFLIQRSKQGTARVALYNGLGIPNVFTLESSFCGPSYEDVHFSQNDLEVMGSRMCLAFLIYFSASPSSPLSEQYRALSELRTNFLQDLWDKDAEEVQHLGMEDSDGSDSCPSDDDLSPKEITKLFDTRKANQSPVFVPSRGKRYSSNHEQSSCSQQLFNIQQQRQQTQLEESYLGNNGIKGNQNNQQSMTSLTNQQNLRNSSQSPNQQSQQQATRHLNSCMQKNSQKVINQVERSGERLRAFKLENEVKAGQKSSSQVQLNALRNKMFCFDCLVPSADNIRSSLGNFERFSSFSPKKTDPTIRQQQLPSLIAKVPELVPQGNNRNAIFNSYEQPPQFTVGKQQNANKIIENYQKPFMKSQQYNDCVVSESTTTLPSKVFLPFKTKFNKLERIKYASMYQEQQEASNVTQLTNTLNNEEQNEVNPHNISMDTINLKQFQSKTKYFQQQRQLKTQNASSKPYLNSQNSKIDQQNEGNSLAFDKQNNKFTGIQQMQGIEKSNDKKAAYAIINREKRQFRTMSNGWSHEFADKVNQVNSTESTYFSITESLKYQNIDQLIDSRNENYPQIQRDQVFTQKAGQFCNELVSQKESFRVKERNQSQDSQRELNCTLLPVISGRRSSLISIGDVKEYSQELDYDGNNGKCVSQSQISLNIASIVSESPYLTTEHLSSEKQKISQLEQTVTTIKRPLAELQQQKGQCQQLHLRISPEKTSNPSKDIRLLSAALAFGQIGSPEKSSLGRTAIYLGQNKRSSQLESNINQDGSNTQQNQLKKQGNRLTQDEFLGRSYSRSPLHIQRSGSPNKQQQINCIISCDDNTYLQEPEDINRKDCYQQEAQQNSQLFQNPAFFTNI